MTVAPLAHGISQRTDLPIPQWLFGWAAAVVLVASFAALALLWPRPRLEAPRERSILRFPAWLEVVCGAIGIAVFALVVYAGLVGSQNEQDNLAPTAVYVLFWVGLAPLSLLFGDVFAAFNPWRALARGAGWASRRLIKAQAPPPLRYPPQLGRWPAALGVVAFVWVELVAPWGSDPSAVAICALLYAATMLVGMTLFGTDTWTRNADTFSVYFGLFAKLSPLRWQRGELFVRPLLSGVTQMRVVPGTVALLLVMIGTTTFDGFSAGPVWNGGEAGGFEGVAPAFLDAFRTLGLAADTALVVAFTVGLIAVLGVVALLYRVGIAGVRSVGGGPPAHQVAGVFAHSLVPIALAYVVAHYFSLLAFQGQATAYLVSDPLGSGADLFGTASATIDYTAVSGSAIWYVQVATLALGHVAGLVLAHDRALTVYTDVRHAIRSQYWMLAIMVAFTTLGLWLLSAGG